MSTTQKPPNLGESLFRPGKSFRAITIREEWVRLGVFRWNNERVTRLCHVIGVTIWDLAAMLAIYDENGDVDTHLVQKFWRNDRWPPYIGILLTNIERDAHDRLKGT